MELTLQDFTARVQEAVRSNINGQTPAASIEFEWDKKTSL